MTEPVNGEKPYVISVRMPPELGRRLREQAKKDARSLNNEIVWLLQAALDRLEAGS